MSATSDIMINTMCTVSKGRNTQSAEEKGWWKDPAVSPLLLVFRLTVKKWELQLLFDLFTINVFQ